MKKMMFIRDEISKKMVAVVKNVSDKGDGCCINIKDNVLPEAMKLGFVENYVEGGKRNKTCFYRFDKITLVTINDNRATVFDSCIKDDKWIGDELKTSGLHYHYSKGKKEQKHTVRIALTNVEWIDKNGNTKRGNHSVALNKFLWDIKVGKVNNTKDLYVYDGKESHHEKASWDNRIDSTMNISNEQHVQHHKSITSASHQMIVNINNIEELQAFLEYVKNN